MAGARQVILREDYINVPVFGRSDKGKKNREGLRPNSKQWSEELLPGMECVLTKERVQEVSDSNFGFH